MVETLLAELPQLATQIDEADVDSREDWQRRYGLKIPVLLDAASGESVCVSQLDIEAVVRWQRDSGA